MKKVLSIVLASVLTLSLVACGGNNTKTENNATKGNNTKTEEKANNKADNKKADNKADNKKESK